MVRYALASQGLLIQAWLPWLPEDTIQSHCWFLSALVPYWLLFDILYRKLILRLTSLRAGCAWLVLLALPPWAAILLPSTVPSIGGWNWCVTWPEPHDARP